MAPSIGRVVLVCLSAECAAKIGGNAREGDEAPALVTGVFPSEGMPLNVRILGDGPGEALWSTSLPYSETPAPGHWRWPPRVEETAPAAMVHG
jgi:hypothetical protein